MKAPTFLEIRAGITDGVTAEYRNNPVDEKKIVEQMAQAAGLAPLVGLSGTDYLRCAICGLKHAGAPERVVIAVTNFYMSVLREDD